MMVSNETSLSIGIICWIILHLIVVPYDCYWCYKFWQQRNELIIKKREPLLVIVFSIASSIFIFLVYTTTLIKCEIREYNSNLSIQNTLQEIQDWFYMPFLWLLILIGIIRYWLIFYLISYNTSIINNKWQSVLDPNIGNQNWYLQNITKWGSFKYIRKYLLIYCIIGYLCSNLKWIVRSSSITITSISFTLFSIFCQVIPVIIGIYILCKLPSFNDDIGIRKELKFSVSIHVSMIILFVFFIIFRTYQIEYYGITIMDNLAHIEWYLFYTLIRILGFTVTLRQTKGILSTFDKILNGRYSSSSVSMMTLAHRNTYAELEKQHSAQDSTDVTSEATRLRQEIRNIIKNPDLFDAFMQLLLNEYCAECLLSIVEFTQFKNKMKDEFNDYEFEDDEDFLIEIPEKMIKSTIVYGKDDYQLIAMDLYRKYIRVASEWEININYRDRNKYIRLFEDEGIDIDDKMKLYKIFDICIKQMFSLLLGSFTRFKHTKQYQMIKDQ